MKISAQGLQAIVDFEGFKSQAYQDVVGVWTIGYGFTDNVRSGASITRAAADVRFRREIEGYELAVMEATQGLVNQNQFDALVSLAWNIGKAGLKKSSVIKAHNRGDYDSAARAFGLWNKAKGKVWPGLTRRRALEAARYLMPVDVPDPMPQAIDTEPAWMATNKAGVVAGGAAVAATISEIATTASTVKLSVATLGDWLMPILLIVAVLAIALLLHQKLMQRKKGVA